MKKLLPTILLLLCSFLIYSQSSVTIKINHLLAGEVFERNIDSKNNLNNDFMIDRLEYYLSTFSIVHDEGQVTPIDDLYVLVGMGDKQGPIDPLIIELGEYDIQSIEGINFYFGIDEEANHGDPALWPEGHPLAPRFPSMHWGWAAGYRFIALEGLSGSNIDQELQFHCIGDEFYKELSFPVSLSGENSYEIEIDAEYSNLLSNIDISNGLILHGNLGDIQTLATNLNERVFTAAEVTSLEESELEDFFEVYPNPSTNGIISIKADAVESDNVIQVYDAMGRIILNTTASTQSFNVTESGIYLVSLIDNQGKTVTTRKIIVQ